MVDEFTPPARGRLLIEAMELLCAKGCIRKPNSWTDEHGIYAIPMQDKLFFPFLLVAKGTQIWKDIISVHKKIVEEWNAPVVFAYARSQTDAVQFFVLDPIHIRQTKEFENTRGSPMVNFPASDNMCYVWDGDEVLADLWVKVKRKRHEKLDYFGE